MRLHDEDTVNLVFKKLSAWIQRRVAGTLQSFVNRLSADPNFPEEATDDSAEIMKKTKHAVFEVLLAPELLATSSATHYLFEPVLSALQRRGRFTVAHSFAPSLLVIAVQTSQFMRQWAAECIFCLANEQLIDALVNEALTEYLAQLFCKVIGIDITRLTRIYTYEFTDDQRVLRQTLKTAFKIISPVALSNVMHAFFQLNPDTTVIDITQKLSRSLYRPEESLVLAREDTCQILELMFSKSKESVWRLQPVCPSSQNLVSLLQVIFSVDAVSKWRKELQLHAQLVWIDPMLRSIPDMSIMDEAIDFISDFAISQFRSRIGPDSELFLAFSMQKVRDFIKFDVESQFAQRTMRILDRLSSEIIDYAQDEIMMKGQGSTGLQTICHAACSLLDVALEQDLRTIMCKLEYLLNVSHGHVSEVQSAAGGYIISEMFWQDLAAKLYLGNRCSPVSMLAMCAKLSLVKMPHQWRIERDGSIRGENWSTELTSAWSDLLNTIGNIDGHFETALRLFFDNQIPRTISNSIDIARSPDFDNSEYTDKVFRELGFLILLYVCPKPHATEVGKNVLERIFGGDESQLFRNITNVCPLIFYTSIIETMQFSELLANLGCSVAPLFKKLLPVTKSVVGMNPKEITEKITILESGNPPKQTVVQAVRILRFYESVWQTLASVLSSTALYSANGTDDIHIVVDNVLHILSLLQTLLGSSRMADSLLKALRQPQVNSMIAGDSVMRNSAYKTKPFMLVNASQSLGVLATWLKTTNSSVRNKALDLVLDIAMCMQKAGLALTANQRRELIVSYEALSPAAIESIPPVKRTQFMSVFGTTSVPGGGHAVVNIKPERPESSLIKPKRSADSPMTRSESHSRQLSVPDDIRLYSKELAAEKAIPTEDEFQSYMSKMEKKAAVVAENIRNRESMIKEKVPSVATAREKTVRASMDKDPLRVEEPVQQKEWPISPKIKVIDLSEEAYDTQGISDDMIAKALESVNKPLQPPQHVKQKTDPARQITKPTYAPVVSGITKPSFGVPASSMLTKPTAAKQDKKKSKLQQLRSEFAQTRVEKPITPATSTAKSSTAALVANSKAMAIRPTVAIPDKADPGVRMEELAQKMPSVMRARLADVGSGGKRGVPNDPVIVPKAAHGPRRIQVIPMTLRGLEGPREWASDEKAKKARLQPSLSPLHVRILRWPTDAREEMPPDLGELEKIPTRFPSVAKYISIFEKLLYLEIWQQIVNSRLERPEESIVCTYIGRQSVDDFVDVTFTTFDEHASDMAESDLILVTFHVDQSRPHQRIEPSRNDGQSKLFDSRSSQVHSTPVFGLVRSSTARARGHEVVVRFCYSDSNENVISAIRPSTRWKFIRLESLHTAQREYAALQSLPYCLLVNHILEGRATPITISESCAGREMPDYAVSESTASEALLGACKQGRIYFDSRTSGYW